ncbi:MAG: DNA-3-methyladenine glycosylase [Planctomycetes bacterium]|nr:DNA-3-methyladenine glycosylase [Planctomycetota bacterium]
MSFVPNAPVLPRSFYARGARQVAKDLLGQWLVLRNADGICAGRIVETEAYCGVRDRACHTFGGRRTPRTETMWGPPGAAYVYFTYGMHWCLNAVCAAEGDPQAVLIRAVEPIEGVNLMRARRGPRCTERDLCRGPARLCQAFGIDGNLNGFDLARSALRILKAPQVPPRDRVRGPRIGVGYAGSDAGRLWRYGAGEARLFSAQFLKTGGAGERPSR